MKSLLKLDYCTFNFADMPIQRVGTLLSGDVDLAWQRIWTSQIDNDLTDCLCQSPLGLFYKPNNGFSERPYTVQVSGVGCHHFASTLPVLYHDSGDVHISRLDFAFDLPFKKSDWREMLQKSYSLSFDKQFKKISQNTNGDASTIYIGSRRSPYYFRIYNKTLEDSHYKLYYNPDFDYDFVIRFEIELKRFSRTLRGVNQIITPEPLFDLYYGDSVSFSRLVDYIKQLWKSYSLEDFLPSCLDEIDFVPEWQKVQNGNFVQFTSDSDFAESCFVQRDNYTESPHSFDQSMHYVLRRFGKYIPFIISNKSDFEVCLMSARQHYGFVPDLIVSVQSDNVWSEIEDVELPPQFETFDFDQLFINTEEGGNYIVN